jgi:hypothetical protein
MKFGDAEGERLLKGLMTFLAQNNISRPKGVLKGESYRHEAFIMFFFLLPFPNGKRNRQNLSGSHDLIATRHK